MLTLLLLIPLLGSLLIIPLEDKNSKDKRLMRQIALIASILNFFLSIYIWTQFDPSTSSYQFINTLNYFDLNLPSSLSLNIGIDSISIYFVILTAFITPVCILSNWEDITVNFKYYLISFLVLETLQIAVFLVLDLLLFYIFFESVLIPLFLIVGIWGSGVSRVRASFMLFLYTLFGSLWMLLAVLVIANNYGSTDFQYLTWAGEISLDYQYWLWLAFFVSFAFKTPLFPVHIWLGWAHTAAPLGGSIILASVILKLATYGYLRILLPILPDATYFYSPLVQTIAVITLIYASLATIRQIDIKGVIAYSSIAHMAVVVFGLFSNTIQGIEGAILLSLAHGFVSPALFICVGGILYHRYHTRTINYYKGLALTMPVFTILFFIFTLANMGTPLTANFVGEFLALQGTFERNPVVGVLAATGIFFSACYSIFLYSRISYGGHSKYLPVTNDINRREFMLLIVLLIPVLVLGIMPNIVLDTLHVNVTQLLYQPNSL